MSKSEIIAMLYVLSKDIKGMSISEITDLYNDALDKAQEENKKRNNPNNEERYSF